ncbi:rhodanese-like domain-containing protein [Botrimarina sp.]|uniref:sulfurtransferase n=1 Tax=Botrimarina sp. TaxID=2795802 RepID=UPI0032EDB1DD
MRPALCVVLLVIAAAGEAAEYPRPELLVDPAELIDHAFGRETSFSEAGVALIDVRPPGGDGEIALRGARRIDVGEWKQAFRDGEGAAAWSERIGRVVHHPDATVVVVDDGVTPDAARAWWILKYWGVEDARLANTNAGQLRQAALRMALSSHQRTPPQAPFVAKAHPERLATRGEVRASAVGGGQAVCLVDTRSDDEVRDGKIPSADHAEWSRFVDPQTGKMRPADELKRLLSGAGFVPTEPSIAYCRSGGRASVVAFAMELMGGERVANYHGSWSDWSSDPTAPVEKPAPAAP